MEFYSSFIFSIDVKIKGKTKTFIAGGRYNDLSSKNLGLRKIPAVGAAVNWEFMNKDIINIGIVSKGRLV